MNEQKEIDRFNSGKGDLLGYECDKCHGKGVIMISMNPPTVRQCECIGVRKSLRRIENSGIKPLMERYTFDRYNTFTTWQEKAKEKAVAFTNDFRGNWFFAGGQSGSGKSHLCTAIVGELLKKGHAAYYMMWRDEAVKLKAIVNNDEEYSNAIQELQRIEILYIDDFFKGTVSKADINLAFQILNFRYVNDLTTVISSEWSNDELSGFDEAIGSRIFEKSALYSITIRKAKENNYRAKSVKNLF